MSNLITEIYDKQAVVDNLNQLGELINSSLNAIVASAPKLQAPIDYLTAVQSISEIEKKNTEVKQAKAKALSDLDKAYQQADKAIQQSLNLEDAEYQAQTKLTSQYKEKIKEQKQLLEIERTRQQTMQNATELLNKQATSEAELRAQTNELIKSSQALRITDEKENAVREKLIAKINQNKKAIKSMTNEVSKQKDNIGNYSSALDGVVGKFSALPGVIGQGASALGMLTKQALAFIATPLGAILTAISLALTAIVKGFKSSEENLNSLKIAFAGFKAVADWTQRLFESMAKTVGKLAQGFADWIKNTKLLSDEAKKQMLIRENLEKAQIKIEKDKRELLKESAKAEFEIAELRAKAIDKEKYSAEERVKFLEEAINKETEISNKRVRQASFEFNTLRALGELAGNTAEFNEQLAQAEAEVWNRKKEHEDTTRRLTKELEKYRKELKGTTEVIKEQIKVVEEVTEEDEAYYEQEVESILLREKVNKQLKEKRDNLLEVADMTDFLDNKLDEFDKSEEERFANDQKRIEERKKAFEDMVSNITEAVQVVTESQMDSIEREADAYQENYERRRQAIENTIMDEVEKDRRLKALDNEKTAHDRQVAKQRAEIQRRQAIFQNSIASAEAMSKAVASVGELLATTAGGDPFTVVARYIAAVAAGVTAVATISSLVSQLIQIPAFAKGGTAEANKPFIAGEQGREIGFGVYSGKVYDFSKPTLFKANEPINIKNARETQQIINNTNEYNKDVTLHNEIVVQVVDNTRIKKYFKIGGKA